MDSKQENQPDNSSDANSGSEESPKVFTSKKSHKKLYIAIVVVVVVVAAAVAGWFWYDKTQNDQKSPTGDDKSAEVKKPLTPEQQELQDLTDQLTENLKTQSEAMKLQAGEEAKKAIADSTAAAKAVAQQGYTLEDVQNAQ